jgi:hypothetical protein
VNNWRDSVNNWRDSVNDWSDSVNNWRDSVNNWRDSVNDWSDSVNNWRDSVNNWRDSVNNPYIPRKLYQLINVWYSDASYYISGNERACRFWRRQCKAHAVARLKYD